jgi:hypothetical protein
MSGDNINFKFGCRGTPLIGDFRRSAKQTHKEKGSLEDETENHIWDIAVCVGSSHSIQRRHCSGR